MTDNTDEIDLRELFKNGRATTGRGKSADLFAHHVNTFGGMGAAYLDPNGDDFEQLLDKIPQHRLDDVTYSNDHNMLRLGSIRPSKSIRVQRSIRTAYQFYKNNPEQGPRGSRILTEDGVVTIYFDEIEHDDLVGPLSRAVGGNDLDEFEDHPAVEFTPYDEEDVASLDSVDGRDTTDEDDLIGEFMSMAFTTTNEGSEPPSDDDAVLFYAARETLSDESWDEFAARARDEFGIDVDQIAWRGEANARSDSGGEDE